MNNNNTTYKDSPLGKIPLDWEVNLVSELGLLISGLHLNTEDYNQAGVGIPYFTGPTDYTNEITSITKWTTKKSALANCGDILITVKGSGVGSLHLLELDKISIGRQIMALRTNENSSNKFIHFSLNHLEYNFKELAKGNMIPGLTRSDILTSKILSPPLPEQKAIAHVLGLMDSAININNQLIAKKELQKKWLMQNLLTGKKRLKGFGGENNKLGAGEIFKSVSVKGFMNEELLSATQDKGIIPRSLLEGRVTMPTNGTESYKLVEPGDFVVSLRSFQGGLEYSYYKGIVSPAYTILKPKKKIDNEFYKQYFKSNDFIGHLAIAVIGIRDGKQISYDDFCTVRIPYPSPDEQTAIARVLKAADKEIQLLKAKTEKLREQKKGLMQVLLTGKKRIKIIR